MRGKKDLGPGQDWQEGKKKAYIKGFLLKERDIFLDKETTASGEKLTCYPWTSQEGCHIEMQCRAEV